MIMIGKVLISFHEMIFCSYVCIIKLNDVIIIVTSLYIKFICEISSLFRNLQLVKFH